MNTRLSQITAPLVAALLVATAAAPAEAAEQKFTLARAVPNDVFLYVAGQDNPEHEFLDRYWGEVFDALAECGVVEDLMEVVGSFLGEEEMAEVERLKERASQLLAGVDWEQLASREMVFAERLPAPTGGPGGGIRMGPPDMVWLFRGSEEGAGQNFDGLVAILEAVVEEINKATGAEAMAVDCTKQMGAKVAAVNLLAMVPGAPPLPLAVAQREDIVIIAMGQEILTDVLGLLNESGSKTALANDTRFRAAFAKLPPAEDSMVFFDMQTMLKPLRNLTELALAEARTVTNVYVRTEVSDEANELTGKALTASSSGDIKKALEFTKQAHEAAPGDCIPLYNLACFHALSGDKEEALDWLEKAVEAGFYGPGKISSDSDLESLRETPRYKAALARAAKLASEHSADDVVLNSVRSGEAHELCMKAWKVYEEEDYQQGLELVEQAYEKAPNDSRVLYYLACFHALLGHEDKALDFLEEAVDGGFYCPRHVSKDPDLESIRSAERYKTALAEARKQAAEIGTRQAAERTAMWKRLVDRIANAVEILDYVATVESTDGYDVRTDSIAALVADAKDRPIYPVFGSQDQLTDFQRYLPQETKSFSVSRGLDLGELYNFIMDTFRAAGPGGKELLTKWAEIQESFGIDVEKDITDWIEGTCVSVTLEDGQGSVWLIRVTDEQVAHEKVTAAVEFLSSKLTEMASGNPMLAMLSVNKSPTLHEQLEGFENLHFVMSPQPIVWGVADGQLIFGNSADAVAMCLGTAKGKHPGIQKNARLMSETMVPEGPFTCVTLTDRRELGEELAQGMGVISMIGGMAGAFIPAPEARPVITKISAMLAKLTPVLRKIDFYKSTATCTTFDGHAWHTRRVTHYATPGQREGGEAE